MPPKFDDWNYNGNVWLSRRVRMLNLVCNRNTRAKAHHHLLFVFGFYAAVSKRYFCPLFMKELKRIAIIVSSKGTIFIMKWLTRETNCHPIKSNGLFNSWQKITQLSNKWLGGYLQCMAQRLITLLKNTLPVFSCSDCCDEVLSDFLPASLDLVRSNLAQNQRLKIQATFLTGPIPWTSPRPGIWSGI